MKIKTLYENKMCFVSSPGIEVIIELKEVSSIKLAPVPGNQ
jgi:hypothetical protein